MPEQAEIMEWRGHEVVDQDGDKVGKLDEIYLDRETRKPEWAVVNTGLFGRKSSFVPLKDALRDGEMIRVPYQKEHISEAPSVDPDGEISPEEEQRVYAHYGLDYSQSESGSGLGQGETPAATGAPGSSGTADGESVQGDAATAGTAGTAGTTDAESTGDGEPAGAPGTADSAGTSAATGGGSSASAGAGDGETAPRMRLQRMIREDVQVSGEGDEVVERRTIQEERLTSDQGDQG
jgi:sporulation protein YlmC with PRC-barrel domain